MEIKYRDIILRDMVESDIEDWIRWYNVDTEWADWDAPDEPIEPVDPAVYRAQELERLKRPLPEFRNFFEIATAAGHHIGQLNAYSINENFEWVSWADVQVSGIIRWTVGIEICESRCWGRGLGRQALAAFILHSLENGERPIYLQTWSGNERMIRCAKRIGFTECNRFVGNRQIHGGTYDSLTFRLDEDAFRAYLRQNP